jgi:hypothetical protein
MESSRGRRPTGLGSVRFLATQRRCPGRIVSGVSSRCLRSAWGATGSTRRVLPGQPRRGEAWGWLGGARRLHGARQGARHLWTPTTGPATPTSRASRRRSDRAGATTQHTIIHRHQRTPITTGRGSRTTSGTLQAGFEPATHGLGMRASTMPTMVSTCDFHVPEIRGSRVTRRWVTPVRVTNRVTGALLHMAMAPVGGRDGLLARR